MELRERGRVDDEEWASLDTISSQTDGLQELASRIRAAVVNEDNQDSNETSEGALGPLSEDLGKANGKLSSLVQQWTIQPQ